MWKYICKRENPKTVNTRNIFEIFHEKANLARENQTATSNGNLFAVTCRFSLDAAQWEMSKTSQCVHGSLDPSGLHQIFDFYLFAIHRKDKFNSQFRRVRRIVSICSQAILFHDSFI